MLDEEKVVDAEVVDAEPVKEEAPVATRPTEDDAKAKNVLVAFILSLIGFGVAWEPVISIAAIILGAIALNKAKLGAGVTRNPHRVFVKIAKPVAIVDVIAGVVMTIVYIITGIIYLVGIATAAMAGGMGA